MKFKLFFTAVSLSFLLASCQFNGTYINREEDKKEGQQALNRFYYYLQGSDIKPVYALFSKKLQTTDSAKIMSFISKVDSSYGSVTGFQIKNWQTNIVRGTNPKSEYLFESEVSRKNGITNEVLGMVKEGEEIKIVRYNVGL